MEATWGWPVVAHLIELYQTVLIPTDGSDAAERAVARGIDLARAYDAALHTLYGVDTRAEPSGLGSD